MSAPDSPPPSRPLANHACPLCGGPNGCVAAATGSYETPCWCAAITFTAAVLDQVPDAQRNQACICRACATKTAAEPR